VAAALQEQAVSSKGDVADFLKTIGSGARTSRDLAAPKNLAPARDRDPE
jgi:hypothetical protein